jgi:DNA-binding transcriptional ArsR family regulator
VAHRPAPQRPGPGPLVRLLGQTRTMVLLAVYDGATNGQLARRIGVSMAAISHHTTILRDAGLLTSRRSGTIIQHSITRLGAAMIRQDLDSRATPWQGDGR